MNSSILSAMSNNKMTNLRRRALVLLLMSLVMFLHATSYTLAQDSIPLDSSKIINRPSLLGFAPAVPQSELLPLSSDNIPGGMRLVPLTLQIDKRGKVSKIIVADSSCSKQFIRQLTHWLDTLLFSPALKNGKPEKSYLISHLLFNPTQKTCRTILPVSREGEVISHPLYTATLFRNGIQGAEIKSFPSFRAPLPISDSLTTLLVGTTELKVSEKGTLLDYKPLGGTWLAAPDLLGTSSLYATFAPAKVKKKPVASTAFLVVSNPPEAGTSLTRAQSSTTREYLSLVDSAGFIFPPTPLSVADSTFTINVPPLKIEGSVTVVLAIDSLGNAAARQVDRDGGEVVRYCRQVAEELRFWPAVDIFGRPRTFMGLAQFTFDGTTTVLVDFSWRHDPSAIFPRPR